MNARQALATFAVAIGVLASVHVPGASGAEKEETLADVFGYGGSPAEQQARFAEQERKRQDAIVSCMRKKGFEYKAFSPQVTSSFTGPPAGEERKWKAQHGYGMADSMGTMSQSMNAFKDDPNQKIRNALSKTAQRAYDKALWAFDSSKPPTPGATLPPTACGNVRMESDKLYEVLGPKLQEMSLRVEADARVVKIRRAWASCMKTNGYQVTKMQDLFEKVLGPEQNKMYESLNKQTNPSAKPGAAFSSPTFAPKQLNDFRKFELKVAKADLDCMSEKDEKLVTEVGKEYERNFIRDNRSAIDKAKQALA